MEIIKLKDNSRTFEVCFVCSHSSFEGTEKLTENREVTVTTKLWSRLFSIPYVFANAPIEAFLK